MTLILVVLGYMYSIQKNQVNLRLCVPDPYLDFFGGYRELVLISCLDRANVRAFHENPNVYTLNSHLLALKAHTHKMYVFLSSTKIFEAL